MTKEAFTNKGRSYKKQRTINYIPKTSDSIGKEGKTKSNIK